MSSTPLLDYPSGICVVFGVIGVETRIAFGAFGKVTRIQGKFFIPINTIDLIQTLNSYSYLRYMVSRTRYSSLSVIHV